MRTRLVTPFLFLLLLPLASTAYASPISSQPHPDLDVRFLRPIPTAAEATYDLGALPDPPRVEVFELEIANTGKGPVSISALGLSVPASSPAGGQLVNAPSSAVIAPGGSLLVRGEVHQDFDQPSSKETVELENYRLDLCFDHSLGTHCTAIVGRTTYAELTGSGGLVYHSGVPYFYDEDRSRYVYLTGSHTWDNFQDWGDGRPDFDFEDYLDFLEEHNHNYIRLWVWEGESVGDDSWPNENIEPLPWGTLNGVFDLYDGAVVDGLPVEPFDPENVRFNPSYFGRLRERVWQAGSRGIYVGVMLFQSFSSYQKPYNDRDPWAHHPFNPANNVDGISGDLDGDSQGQELYSIDLNSSDPYERLIADLQKAYVARVLEALQNEKNVIYEIINEAPHESIEEPNFWQQSIRSFIRDTEAERNYIRHPVGRTATDGNNSHLDSVTSTWISHSGTTWAINPPAADGSKVVINDTDHMSFLNNDPNELRFRRWVWKSATRGLNPILMDPIQNPIGDPDRPLFLPSTVPILIKTRQSMGQAAQYMSLLPLGDLETDGVGCGGYCIYQPDGVYLSYQPDVVTSPALEVGEGQYYYEWLDPRYPQQGPVASGMFVGPLTGSPPGPNLSESVLYVVNANVDAVVEAIVQPEAGDYLPAEKVLRYAVVSLANGGDANIFSVDVDYDIRDAAGQVVSAWTSPGIETSIAPGDSGEVLLGTLELPLALGQFTFNVEVTAVNGIPDSDPSSNSGQVAFAIRNEPAIVAEFKRGPETPGRNVKVSFSASPSEDVSYHFDESLGRWAEHPDRPCNTGQDNPTYFRLRAYAPGFISAARFQASWDAQPTVANPGILEAMNEGASFVIATDDYRLDAENGCVLDPTPWVLPGETHWMWLELTTGGQVVERVIRFVKQ